MSKNDELIFQLKLLNKSVEEVKDLLKTMLLLERTGSPPTYGPEGVVNKGPSYKTMLGNPSSGRRSQDVQDGPENEHREGGLWTPPPSITAPIEVMKCGPWNFPTEIPNDPPEEIDKETKK